MTGPAHIVLPPRPVPQSVCWWTECTCGDQIIAETAEEVRVLGVPHREAERGRVDGSYDTERAAARRRRREAGRHQRRGKPSTTGGSRRR